MILAYYGMYKREGEAYKSNFDIKVKVHLPQTTKKLKIVIEKERNSIVEATRSESQNIRGQVVNGTTNTTHNDSNYVAGLSFLLFDTKYWETNVNTGMKLLLPLDPYIKISLDKSIKTKAINIYIGQKFVKYRQGDFSEVTQLSFSRALGRSFSIGQSNALSWTDENDTFNGRNSLSLSHSVTDRVSMSYGIGASSVLSPTFHYVSYDATVGFRQLLHKKWLYIHLSGGADFQKENDFHAEQFVASRLEIFFK